MGFLRPVKRHVVKRLTQEFTRREPVGNGKMRDVKLWRLYLDCGHYVDLSQRKRKRPPKARKSCTYCRHGAEPIPLPKVAPVAV